MKILFVAVFTKSSDNYSQAIAFEQLGHQVIRYSYRDIGNSLGAIGRNLDLVKTCKEQKPDLMVISKGNSIPANVVTSCNKFTTTCIWYMDPPDGNWTSELLEKMQEASFVVCDKKVTEQLASRYNPNVYYITDGYDPEVDKPYEVCQDIPCSFIGAVKESRSKFISAYPTMQIFNNALVDEHAKTVSRSKINLNFCSLGTVSHRLFKIMAAGGFMLTDHWDGLEERFIDGKHLVVFSSPTDMKDKIDYYLSHEEERKEIARQGLLAIKPYNKEGWARKILDAYTEVVSEK